MNIIERISETERRLRGAGFNAPAGYDSFKATCFQAADLLAKLHDHVSDLAECLVDAVREIEGTYGPNTLLAHSVTKDWKRVLAEGREGSE